MNNMDLNEIIAYPTKREDWLKTVLIGGVLTFFSVLLIPVFVVFGYVVRTVRYSLEGEPEPPAFEEWGELLVDGVQAWVISLLYMLVPLIIAGVTIGGRQRGIGVGIEDDPQRRLANRSMESGEVEARQLSSGTLLRIVIALVPNV